VPKSHENLKLPGVGEKMEKCEEVRSRAVCSSGEDHGFIVMRGSNCGRPECPIHWKTWCNRAADRIQDRVCGFKQAAYENKTPVPFANHVIWSPDPSYLQQFEGMDVLNPEHAKIMERWLRSQFKEVSRYAGSFAGKAIIHLLRIKPEYKDELSALADKLGKKSIWDTLRTCPDWYDKVHFSPHVHTASYGHLQKSNEFYSETGWFYKNKGPLKDNDDVYRWAYYALSHVLLIPDVRSSFDYGFMAGRYLRVKAHCRYTCPLLCPECGRPMVIEVWDGDKFIRTDEEATTTRLDNVYEILTPPPRRKRRRPGPPGQPPDDGKNSATSPVGGENKENKNVRRESKNHTLPLQ
jgi:hypothetical protein